MGKEEDNSDFLTEISEWAQSETQKRKKIKNEHLVAFNANKEDIQQALQAGYSMKIIWEHLIAKGKLSCCYETFTLHVKRANLRGTNRPQTTTT
ncbi:hypothetical protein E1162_03035 [Rhodobacteraceae bacterium RKSG542]|uniref:TraK family protein n=1 Tax=Pseudovibrio flavus TaxID=2529854 RepID=UPI0012BC369A|nr:TraK family protein [Pseudovibrio flavus]MTI16210.1 hypothetical protein [Pseudovibrio flavus]